MKLLDAVGMVPLLTLHFAHGLLGGVTLVEWGAVAPGQLGLQQQHIAYVQVPAWPPFSGPCPMEVSSRSARQHL